MDKPSLETIERALTEAGISYSLEDDECLLRGFEAENYREFDGHQMIAMRIWIESPCPDLYSIVLEVRELYFTAGLVSGRILQILCEQSNFNGIAYTYSRETAEVKARVIVPLMGRRIDSDSFALVVSGFAHEINIANPLIQTLLDRDKKESDEFMKEIEVLNREAIDNQDLGEDSAG
jgi:hypothetical protein